MLHFTDASGRDGEAAPAAEPGKLAAASSCSGLTVSQSAGACACGASGLPGSSGIPECAGKKEQRVSGHASAAPSAANGRGVAGAAGAGWTVVERQDRAEVWSLPDDEVSACDPGPTSTLDLRRLPAAIIRGAFPGAGRDAMATSGTSPGATSPAEGLYNPDQGLGGHIAEHAAWVAQPTRSGMEVWQVWPLQALSAGSPHGQGVATLRDTLNRVKAEPELAVSGASEHAEACQTGSAAESAAQQAGSWSASAAGGRRCRQADDAAVTLYPAGELLSVAAGPAPPQGAASPAAATGESEWAAVPQTVNLEDVLPAAHAAGARDNLQRGPRTPTLVLEQAAPPASPAAAVGSFAQLPEVHRRALATRLELACAETAAAALCGTGAPRRLCAQARAMAAEAGARARPAYKAFQSVRSFPPCCPA